jgi:NCAIR mutase (PurE)-related protein
VTESDLQTLTADLLNNKITRDEMIARIKSSLFRLTDLGFANLDHHRELRHGLCEVVYGEGKSLDQICQILVKLSEPKKCVLTTRVNQDTINALKLHFPVHRENYAAGTFTVFPHKPISKDACETFVAIISAGTCDIKVAEEAFEVCVAMQVPVEKFYDIGVSGLHRLLGKLPEIQKASVVIVVAGMEGALPSVVGGLIGCPVIAVPTSVGYGANFSGLSSLLGMLNSCAPGVTVTNIDGGFSGGFAAARIFNEMKRK